MPTEMTDLVSKGVYTVDGTYIGTVEDIQIDLDRNTASGLALTEINSEFITDEIRSAEGILLPYRWVRDVDDIVVVKGDVKTHSQLSHPIKPQAPHEE